MGEERRRTGDRVAEEGRDMAREALHKIETHERVCTERYGTIVRNLAEERELQKERHGENQDAIKNINERMWVAAGAVIVSMLGLITTLILTAPKP